MGRLRSPRLTEVTIAATRLSGFGIQSSTSFPQIGVRARRLAAIWQVFWQVFWPTAPVHLLRIPRLPNAVCLCFDYDPFDFASLASPLPNVLVKVDDGTGCSARKGETGSHGGVCPLVLTHYGDGRRKIQPPPWFPCLPQRDRTPEAIQNPSPPFRLRWPFIAPLLCPQPPSPKLHPKLICG